MRKLNQSGDTIVEVLIAIGIVSVVLVAALAISNVSLRRIRMAQERSEAQKLAAGAVEGVDLYVDSNGHTPYGSQFCRLPNSMTLQNAAIPANCNFGTEGRYHVATSRLNNGTTNTYRTEVAWDGLDGTRQNVVFVYRARKA